MDFLFSFDNFVNEAYMTSHGALRKDERVENLKSVTINPAQTRAIRDLGLEPFEVKQQIIALIKDRFSKETDAIIDREFGEGSRVTPVMAAKLTIDGKSDYITMAVTSGIYKKDKVTKEMVKVGEKNFVGEKIYYTIVDNNITTLLVFPWGIPDTEIRKQVEEHHERTENPKRVYVTPFSDNLVLDLEIVDGKVVEKQRATDNSFFIDYTKEQQWMIAPGRKLKVFIPFAKDFVEVEILSLENPSVRKVAGREPIVSWHNEEDKTFEIIVQFEWQDEKTQVSKQMKLKKKLAKNDTVFLPIGQNEEMIRCKITGHVIDSRRPDPVNLKFIALK